MNTLRIHYSLKTEEAPVSCFIDLQVKDTYESFVKQRSMQLDYVLNILAKVQGYKLDKILKIEEIRCNNAEFPWKDFKDKKVSVKIVGEKNSQAFLKEAEKHNICWSNNRKATSNMLIMYYARNYIPFWIICDGDNAEMISTVA